MLCEWPALKYTTGTRTVPDLYSCLCERSPANRKRLQNERHISDSRVQVITWSWHMFQMTPCTQWPSRTSTGIVPAHSTFTLLKIKLLTGWLKGKWTFPLIIVFLHHSISKLEANMTETDRETDGQAAITTRQLHLTPQDWWIRQSDEK